MTTIQFLKLIWMLYGRGKLKVKSIEKMGLLAIKIGQVHALRADFLPLEKCRQLSALYRKTLPVTSEDILSCVDRSFFESIDPSPLASASIGQVHKAILKDGSCVVIKIIKKDFETEFLKEIRRVKQLFKIFLFFYPKLKKGFDPLEILEHIQEYTLREMNLLHEIEGQEILKSIYTQHKNGYDLSKLSFPKIYKELSSKTVMVSEYIPGKTFDQILETGLGYQLLLELFNIQGFFIFQAGVFHGDLHPGNLMFYEDKIYFLDTGALGRVKAKIQKGLLNFFEALSEFDYSKAALALNQMAEKPLKKEKFEMFEKRFHHLYIGFKDSTVSEVSLTKKMMQTIKLGVDCGMTFEKGMFAIVKSMMFLDGMVLRNNPEAILLKDMRVFIEHFKIYQKLND